jgi:DNA-binding NarL/FixJ family response regulator
LLVVAEIADGLEAVQRAKELQPDLILLDIGLPRLNGIQAANRIRQVAAGAKILFLTLDGDQDVVRTALSTGAQGYVLKTDAGRELLPAVAGVLGGDDFVSSGIKTGDPGETDDW